PASLTGSLPLHPPWPTVAPQYVRFVGELIGRTGNRRHSGRSASRPPVSGPRRRPAAVTADPAPSGALRAVTDVVLGLAGAGEPALEPLLERLVDAVRDLVGARYAALGIPDDAGTGFDRFITSGMSDEQIDAIGPLPRTHGLLAAMLTDPEPYRTDDIRADPRFEWWPEAHPRMRSFLGVPLVFKGDIVGAFYLTDKEGGFDEADVELVRGLAAHAAVVIENARLFEASRERSIAEERSRLARDLHDALTQRLFSLNLTLEAAAATAGAAGRRPRRRPPQARRAGRPGPRRAGHGRRPPAAGRDRPGRGGGGGAVAGGAGGALQRPAARGGLGGDGHRRGGPLRRRHAAVGGRRRRRLRPAGPVDRGAPARSRVDAGTGGGGRRAVRDRLRSRTGDDRAGVGPGAVSGAAPVRLLIVDDHPVVRQGLRTFL